MPIPFNNEQLRIKALKALSETTLNHFTVLPESSAPFGKQELSWSVQAPQGVGLRINSQRVATEGAETKELKFTTIFRLMANYSVYQKLLATVTARINLTACVIATSGDTIENILGTMMKGLMEENEEFNGYYFPEGWNPEVKITNGDFYFRIKFKKSVNTFPDPEVCLVLK